MNVNKVSSIIVSNGILTCQNWLNVVVRKQAHLALVLAQPPVTRLFNDINNSVLGEANRLRGRRCKVIQSYHLINYTRWQLWLCRCGLVVAAGCSYLLRLWLLFRSWSRCLCSLGCLLRCWFFDCCAWFWRWRNMLYSDSSLIEHRNNLLNGWLYWKL